MPIAVVQPFISLDHLEYRVTHANHPEDLRDIICFIFHEMANRGTGFQAEKTGFEAATDYELKSAFYRTANEMVRRKIGRASCRERV